MSAVTTTLTSTKSEASVYLAMNVKLGKQKTDDANEASRRVPATNSDGCDANQPTPEKKDKENPV